MHSQLPHPPHLQRKRKPLKSIIRIKNMLVHQHYLRSKYHNQLLARPPPPPLVNPHQLLLLNRQTQSQLLTHPHPRAITPRQTRVRAILKHRINTLLKKRRKLPAARALLTLLTPLIHPHPLLLAVVVLTQIRKMITWILQHLINPVQPQSWLMSKKLKCQLVFQLAKLPSSQTLSAKDIFVFLMMTTVLLL